MSAEPFDDDVNDRDRLIGRYVLRSAAVVAALRVHKEHVAKLEALEDQLAEAIDAVVVAAVECDEAERVFIEASARCAEINGEARRAFEQMKAEIAAKRAIASFVDERRSERAA